MVDIVWQKPYGCQNVNRFNNEYNNCAKGDSILKDRTLDLLH